MCGGVKYEEPIDQKEWKIYFPNPKAALPVANPDGTIEWIKWGRRKEEHAPFVQGGWARLDSILNGKWESYNPQPVKLAVQAFMEKDESRVSHWIDVAPGFAIEALVIERGEKRVYVVTEDTPPEFSWVHDRWPRLVKIG